jgi:hypothetical protein
LTLLRIRITNQPVTLSRGIAGSLILNATAIRPRLRTVADTASLLIRWWFSGNARSGRRRRFRCLCRCRSGPKHGTVIVVLSERPSAAGIAIFIHRHQALSFGEELFAAIIPICAAAVVRQVATSRVLVGRRSRWPFASIRVSSRNPMAARSFIATSLDIDGDAHIILTLNS